MKKKLSILLLLFICFATACKQKTGQTENQSQNQSETDTSQNPGSLAEQSFVVNNISDTSLLPKGIAHEGRIKEAIRYTDKLGEHIVITTETGIYRSPKFKHENDGADAELFACHFNVKKDNTIEESWKVYDYIADCPVDIEANFLKNTLQVTDLNDDGVAEIWIVYIRVCHGDVSPPEMKIIMYEGQQKFAMRGEQKIDLGNGEVFGGEYKFDDAFKRAPEKFREYAKRLWNENLMYKLGRGEE